MGEFNMRKEMNEAVQAMCESSPAVDIQVEKTCNDVEALLNKHGYTNVCSSEQNCVSILHFLREDTHITLTVVTSEDEEIISDLVDREDSGSFNLDDFTRDTPELARELRFA